jgi:hypothetical protein
VHVCAKSYPAMSCTLTHLIAQNAGRIAHEIGVTTKIPAASLEKKIYVSLLYSCRCCCDELLGKQLNGGGLHQSNSEILLQSKSMFMNHANTVSNFESWTLSVFRYGSFPKTLTFSC